MILKQQPNNANSTNSFGIKEQIANEVISIEECKQFVGGFNLSDQKICEIRNYMIGIANKTINSYLDNFK